MLLVIGLVNVLQSEQFGFDVDVQFDLLLSLRWIYFDSRRRCLCLSEILIKAHGNDIGSSCIDVLCRSFLQNAWNDLWRLCVSWNEIVVRPNSFINLVQISVFLLLVLLLLFCNWSLRRRGHFLYILIFLFFNHVSFLHVWLFDLKNII